MSNQQILWFLKMYDKSGDFPISTHELEGIQVRDLQQLFDEPPDDPMYETYRITDSQVEWLQNFTGIKINLQLYDYFVECEAIN